MVAAHLQRVILHLVFHTRQFAGWEQKEDPADLIALVPLIGGKLFRQVCDYLAEHHEGEYLASLSKNAEKCAVMVRSLLAGQNADLYSGLS